MSDNPEMIPAGETQPPAEEKTDAIRVQLLEAKNQELLSEKQKVRKQVDDLQKQIADMQAATTQQRQSELQEQGEYKQLWQQATETNNSLQQQMSDLQAALEQKDLAYQEQQMRAKAISTFQQAGALNAEDLYELEKNRLRLGADGRVIALNGGVETQLSDYVASMKAPESQRSYLFQGNGARGMGATNSAVSATNGQGNPYISRNFTEIVKLETENPDLAARLKAQAAQG